MSHESKVLNPSASELVGLLGEKTVKFCLNSLFDKTEVEIKIPDLSQNRYSVWGDWGPMYTLQLNPKSPIRITFHLKDRSEEYGLDCKTVQLNSPMLVDERKEFPLCFEIEDSAKDLKYHVFLDSSGTPKKVRVFQKFECSLI